MKFPHHIHDLHLQHIDLRLILLTIDRADPDKNHLFLRDQLFKDSDNIQVMFDHLPCLTQEILFLIQGSDLSPDLDPDLDLEQI